MNRKSKTPFKFNDITGQVVKDLFAALGSNLDPLRKPKAYLETQIESLMTESLSADAVKCDYLAHEVMSKYNNFNLHHCPKEAAYKSFFANEQKCSETNARILSYERGNSKSAFLERVIHTAQVKIRRILPDLSWELLRSNHEMTTGASVFTKRRHATSACKLENPEVTLRALRVWSMVTEELDIFESPVIVNHSKVTTVPKNSKTDRLICIEPSGNMLLQKAIGNYISKQMCKQPMVDLHDQSVNQQRALRASLVKDEATVDFSAASDTISIETVRLLLPPDWFNYLNMIRVPVVEINGSLHKLSKFSAMGNGFTFELETLLFWAIAQSIEDLLGTSTLVSQYGDDLICSTLCYEQALPIFAFFGFTINVKKTFATGNFRESCGMHYYDGVDVSPFYIRRPIDNQNELMLFLNNLRIWCDRLNLMLDPRFEHIYNKYASLLSDEVRSSRVPHCLSSCGLIGPLSEHEHRVNSSKIEVYMWIEQMRGRPSYYRGNPNNSRNLLLHTRQLDRSLLGLDALPIVSMNKTEPSGSFRLRRRWVWLGK
uniref:RNA-directed RNA polymerase n=1 Tax=Wenzhou levi-like virus 3 TaxID=1923569 RepID=A0A1L3KIZ6_9VIRU|nr:hypothetical protein [Wenzhou levi-like virus 3]